MAYSYLILSVILCVGVEPLNLIPSVFRPLTWPLAETGPCHRVEVGGRRIQAPLPARSTDTTAFDNPTTGCSFLSALSAPGATALGHMCSFPPTIAPASLRRPLFAHAVAAIHVFPLLAVKPPRRGIVIAEGLNRRVNNYCGPNTEVPVAQGKHAPIFLEGSAPRSYSIECEHRPSHR